MLENVLEVLESETAIQRGCYMGQTESPEHFEKRKSQAIDILSEILHYRLPQPLTRLRNDALH